jgi:uncharacterized membrane protein
LVQEIKSSAPVKPKNKALHFVLAMGGAVLGVCLVCGLIWWLVGDQDYDALGRYIIIAGIILIFFGIATLSSRGGRNTWSEQKNREIDARRKKSGEPRKDTLVLVFFCGIGLLCVFIGNLIIKGL